jgi:hypothetical protein
MRLAADQRRKVALLLAGAGAAVGVACSSHDVPTLGFLVGAAGLICSRRGWEAWEASCYGANGGNCAC